VPDREQDLEVLGTVRREQRDAIARTDAQPLVQAAGEPCYAVR